jgi:hypothetical protein
MLEMQNIELPRFRILKGKEAIKALHEYIDELQKTKENILTAEQTSVMIKLAQGLIATIKDEAQSEKPTKRLSPLAQVKNVLNSLVRESPKGPTREMPIDIETFKSTSNVLRLVQHL